ncbi:MAG TPA: amino acid ABC transporter substrate-binding protein [Ktedonobacterales bacterium]
MTGRQSHWMRKLTSIAGIALAALLAFSACGTQNTSAGNTKPIVIGASLSTSGDFADDGKAFQQGYQLWADQVNAKGGLLGRQVKLDIVGDNSTPDQVTTNYQKLITVDKVDLVIGPYSSLLTKPASVVTNRYGYALLEGAGGAPSVFNRGIKGLYDVSVPVENLLLSFGQMLAAMPADKRPSTIAYATEDDPFTQPQIDKVKALLEGAGFKTVYYQVFPSETTDYTPIASAVINKHADVFIGGTHILNSEAFVKIFKQQHYNPKAIMFTAGPDVGAPFVQAVGAANTEGIAFANSWWPELNNARNNAFVQAFSTKYGVKIDEISSDSAEAFAVGEVLQQAVEQCKCVDNAKLIQTLNTSKFDSVQGPVKFNSVGENDGLPAYTLQWQKGNVVCVYPSPPATTAMEYPKPNWAD